MVEGDNTVPVIWSTYEAIISRHDEAATIEYEERFAFYNRSRQSYAIVITGEEALYGNIIIKKGVIKPEDNN
ncbi:L-fucose mutarotase [compost metagenome]